MVTIPIWVMLLIVALSLITGVRLGILLCSRATNWAILNGRAYIYSEKRGWVPKHPTRHTIGDEK